MAFTEGEGTTSKSQTSTFLAYQQPPSQAWSPISSPPLLCLSPGIQLDCSARASAARVLWSLSPSSLSCVEWLSSRTHISSQSLSSIASTPFCLAGAKYFLKLIVSIQLWFPIVCLVDPLLSSPINVPNIEQYPASRTSKVKTPRALINLLALSSRYPTICSFLFFPHICDGTTIQPQAS